MNYEERQAAVARGHADRGFWQYVDLAFLIAIFFFVAFPTWILFPQRTEEIFPFLALLTLTGLALNAIWLFWQTGKIEVIAEKPIPMGESCEALESLGYTTSSFNDYAIEATRKLAFLPYEIHLTIFTHDGKTMGYGWLEGHRFSRMPFMTGKTYVAAFRKKLLSNHVTNSLARSADAAAPNRIKKPIAESAKRKCKWTNKR
jgi:hypothetical protein